MPSLCIHRWLSLSTFYNVHFHKNSFFFVARPSASDFPFSLIFQSLDPLHMKSLAMRNYGTYQQVGGCWRRHFGRCGSGLSAPQPKLKRRTDIFYYLSQMYYIIRFRSTYRKRGGPHKGKSTRSS